MGLKNAFEAKQRQTGDGKRHKTSWVVPSRRKYLDANESMNNNQFHFTGVSRIFNPLTPRITPELSQRKWLLIFCLICGPTKTTEQYFHVVLFAL